MIDTKKRPTTERIPKAINDNKFREILEFYYFLKRNQETSREILAIHNYLKNNIASVNEVSVALNISIQKIHRYKRMLENLGVLAVTRKTIDPRTHRASSLLTTDQKMIKYLKKYGQSHDRNLAR